MLLLIAIGEEGNILHRAAQILELSKPSASRLLKDLEDQVAEGKEARSWIEQPHIAWIPTGNVFSPRR